MITQVWNPSFEAIPADNDQVSEGALRIRNLKRDIRERAEVDHVWDSIADSGKHKQLTFVDPLVSDPATVQDQGYVYTKNVSGVVELHWKDEVGNVLALTIAGKIPGSALASNAVFPAGTKMLFQQTAAPTGWTKDVAQNDKALRVVNGTAGVGGVSPFTTVFGAGKVTGSHVLTIAEIPSHDHFAVEARQVGTSGPPVVAAGSGALQYNIQTGLTGGGLGHTHTLPLDLQFVDVIIASKD